MSNSYARLSNIWAEYIMEWFYNSIISDGGDGAAVICCGNPEETADFFIDWWKKKHLAQMKRSGYKLDEFFNPKDIYTTMNNKTIVNFHNGNENFMFSNGIIDLGHNDVTFVIEEDCPSYDTFVIKAIRV